MITDHWLPITDPRFRFPGTRGKTHESMLSRSRMFMPSEATMARHSLLNFFSLVSILLVKPCSTLIIQSLRPSVIVTGDTNLSAFRLQEPRGRRNMSKGQRQQRGGLRRRLECLTKIPSGKDPYPTLRKQTAEATQTAINSGIKLIELEFPPVRGKLDISLSETLDANRAFARELARTFSAKMGQELWLVFPDDAEAALARKTYGGTTFRVVSIQSAIKDLKDDACQLQIVVNPGFNVDEWIVLDKLARPDVPMVMLNGGLDRLRGGYYPRIFYPGLYNATQRFLKNFETVYYLKAVPGGWIFRKAPEDWQIICLSQTGNKQGRQATESKVLEFTADRPDYNHAVKVVQAAAQRAQEGR